MKILHILIYFDSDVLDVKLEKAKELGADYVVKTTREMTEQDITQLIRDTLKEEPHASFDCCGVELCVRVALNVSLIRYKISVARYCYSISDYKDKWCGIVSGHG